MGSRDDSRRPCGREVYRSAAYTFCNSVSQPALRPVYLTRTQNPVCVFKAKHSHPLINLTNKIIAYSITSILKKIKLNRS